MPLPPVAPASTTPAPTDSAATTNTPATTTARRALTARLHSSASFIPQSPLCLTAADGRVLLPPSDECKQRLGLARPLSDCQRELRAVLQPLPGPRALREHLALLARGRGLARDRPDAAVRPGDLRPRLADGHTDDVRHDAGGQPTREPRDDRA